MKWIDLTLPSPEENLALDEALLDHAESGDGGEVLRFWEPFSPFVVLGYSNRWQVEADAAACEKRGIPILRRCSGGGTILQAPGCLNYAVVLRADPRRGTDSITGTTRYVLQRNADALVPLLNEAPQVRGLSDLALGPRKFSGNAQRRRKHFTLMHGTLLLGFDAALVEECLRMPSKQPDYRENRSHSAFLTSLPATADAVKEAFKKAWETSGEMRDYPRERVSALVGSAYGTAAWNRKF